MKSTDVLPHLCLLCKDYVTTLINDSHTSDLEAAEVSILGRVIKGWLGTFASRKALKSMFVLKNIIQRGETCMLLSIVGRCGKLKDAGSI